MQVRMIRLWCNDYKNLMFKAFMSALLLDDRVYVKVPNPETADVWCLVDAGMGISGMVGLYQELLNKPTVIYLARDFYPPPVSTWVFFKSPVHVTALLNWIKSQKFTDEGGVDSASNGDVKGTVEDTPLKAVAKERWRQEPFKLSYWPNVTLYSDSPDIMVICTALLRSWLTYDTLPETNLEPEVLNRMLSDAHEEGNLHYQQDSSTEIAGEQTNNHQQNTQQKDSTAQQTGSSQSDDKRNVKHNSDGSLKDDSLQSSALEKNRSDKGWGFFKSLLNRFVS